MKKTKDDAVNLEKSLTEVTKLIEKMEHGDLSLEQSLETFEQGITLIKTCQKILTDAEQKVQMLIEKNGKAELAPYASEKNKDA